MNQQKDYFKKRIQAIQNEIWGMEFDRYKTGEVREEVRQEYDKKKAQLVNLEQDIKQQQEQPTRDKGEIARLEDQKVLLERDIQRHIDQMKDCDVQVFGQKPSAQNTEGVQGINEKLDIFRSYKEMLEDYLKKI